MGGISLWDLPYIYYTNNASYKRVQALEEMASTEYRSEVLSGDLVEYILDEHQKATSNLASLSDDYPTCQLSMNEYPIHMITHKLLGDLPMMYCAFVAITQPQTLSVSQIAIWSECSLNLTWSIQTVLDNVQSFRRSCQSLHDLYDAENIKTMIVDGDTSYSSSQEEKSKGMSFDVRHLSFAYPGSQSSEGAINDISFSIKAGQVVVIVGSNGSGKSTIIKLLTRVYDPTSDGDSILVDGLPISTYRIADLRRSTAVLTQEHSLFPLSLGENIGLGHVIMKDDLAAVQHAAEMGGALHCLSKVKDGFNTVLDPRNEPSFNNLPDDEEHPLNVELSQLPTAIELSGGEEQRIVASRTFMRFNSGLVRFVAVDEPSSALDPEGEAALFENLIKAREGKTLVFVTHRFGHLTKHADLILCMKDGNLVESGRHAELLGLNGEYANLYNVQASAFIDQMEPKD
ncbi:P-loop containing nucleoside triphosphate hydrolase protein [Hymenopellis radicata]|nr:P-loop containing nucleoside triphosphate hydrolase protein [Hymenopellis radicata]